ncbi:MAG: transposase, partial [Cytophagaceae bacterium]
MEKRRRRLFPREFKDDAVRQVVDAGKRASVVARDVGISEALLGRWVRETKALGAERFVGTGHQTKLEEENRRLRKENARLLEERTILKKAARFMLLEKPGSSLSLRDTSNSTRCSLCASCSRFHALVFIVGNDGLSAQELHGING